MEITCCPTLYLNHPALYKSNNPSIYPPPLPPPPSPPASSRAVACQFFLFFFSWIQSGPFILLPAAHSHIHTEKAKHSLANSCSPCVATGAFLHARVYSRSHNALFASRPLLRKIGPATKTACNSWISYVSLVWSMVYQLVSHLGLRTDEASGRNFWWLL